MPVFAVLAHNEPELLDILIDSLAPHPVVVHVDAKSDIDQFSGISGATFIQDRVDVRWGGFSVVDATIRLFEAAIMLAKPDDHIVLISGQCQPTQPIANFVDFLATSDKRQHCKAALVFDGTDYAERRLARSWYFDVLPLNRRSRLRKPVSAVRHAMTKLTPKKGQSHFAPYKPVAGSQWIALTAACLRDILPTAKGQEYQALFNRSLAPDEMFFHTLVHNSQWAAEAGESAFEPRNMRGTATFANFHHIDPSLSRDLDMEDLPAIRESGAYFARKFSRPRSKALLAALHSAEAPSKG